MNFATQIRTAIGALALFMAIGVVALATAASDKPDSEFDVMPTSIEIVAPATGDGPTTMARVDVGSPVMTSANPSAADIARASH